jgi:hypothetical protein
MTKASAQSKAVNDRLKMLVFRHYCGGEPRCQCVGCDITYIGFLTLDHVNGDGAAHRKKHNLRTGGAYLWRWVRDHGFPPEFQVLCCNCNHSKFNGRACALNGKTHYERRHMPIVKFDPALPTLEA